MGGSGEGPGCRVTARAKRLIDAAAGGPKATLAAAVRKRARKNESRRGIKNEELPGRSRYLDDVAPAPLRRLSESALAVTILTQAETPSLWLRTDVPIRRLREQASALQHSCVLPCQPHPTSLRSARRFACTDVQVSALSSQLRTRRSADWDDEHDSTREADGRDPLGELAAMGAAKAGRGESTHATQSS
jgi:hypothetical protein